MCMFLILSETIGLLLFTALLFPIEIIEELFNLYIEYESNPKLFSRYFFISNKRGN